jgi:hypothetical protein
MVSGALNKCSTKKPCASSCMQVHAVPQHQHGAQRPSKELESCSCTTPGSEGSHRVLRGLLVQLTARVVQQRHPAANFAMVPHKHARSFMKCSSSSQKHAGHCNKGCKLPSECLDVAYAARLGLAAPQLKMRNSSKHDA